MNEVGSTKNKDFTFTISIKVSHKGKWGATIICSYVEDDDRATLRRSLQRKGLELHHIDVLSRVAEPGEVYRQYEVMYRIPFITYNDWDKLIEDEKKYTDREDWYVSLEKLKKQYPQFINPTIQIL